MRGLLCTTCGQRFQSKSSFRIHRVRQHPELFAAGTDVRQRQPKQPKRHVQPDEGPRQVDGCQRPHTADGRREEAESSEPNELRPGDAQTSAGAAETQRNVPEENQSTFVVDEKELADLELEVQKEEEELQILMLEHLKQSLNLEGDGNCEPELPHSDAASHQQEKAPPVNELTSNVNETNLLSNSISHDCNTQKVSESQASPHQSQSFNDLFICTICQKPNETKEAYIQHVKTFHDPANPLTSESSNISFVVADPHQCSFCMQRFRTKNRLEAHITTFHNLSSSRHHPSLMRSDSLRDEPCTTFGRNRPLTSNVYENILRRHEQCMRHAGLEYVSPSHTADDVPTSTDNTCGSTTETGALLEAETWNIRKGTNYTPDISQEHTEAHSSQPENRYGANLFAKSTTNNIRIMATDCMQSSYQQDHQHTIQTCSLPHKTPSNVYGGTHPGSTSALSFIPDGNVDNQKSIMGPVNHLQRINTSPTQTNPMAVRKYVGLTSPRLNQQSYAGPNTNSFKSNDYNSIIQGSSSSTFGYGHISPQSKYSPTNRKEPEFTGVNSQLPILSRETVNDIVPPNLGLSAKDIYTNTSGIYGMSTNTQNIAQESTYPVPRCRMTGVTEQLFSGMDPVENERCVQIAHGQNLQDLTGNVQHGHRNTSIHRLHGYSMGNNPALVSHRNIRRYARNSNTSAVANAREDVIQISISDGDEKFGNEAIKIPISGEIGTDPLHHPQMSRNRAMQQINDDQAPSSSKTTSKHSNDYSSHTDGVQIFRKSSLGQENQTHNEVSNVYTEECLPEKGNDVNMTPPRLSAKSNEQTAVAACSNDPMLQHSSEKTLQRQNSAPKPNTLVTMDATMSASLSKVQHLTSENVCQKETINETSKLKSPNEPALSSSTESDITTTFVEDSEQYGNSSSHKGITDCNNKSNNDSSENLQLPPYQAIRQASQYTAVHCPLTKPSSMTSIRNADSNSGQCRPDEAQMATVTRPTASAVACGQVRMRERNLQLTPSHAHQVTGLPTHTPDDAGDYYPLTRATESVKAILDDETIPTQFKTPRTVAYIQNLQSSLYNQNQKQLFPPTSSQCDHDYNTNRSSLLNSASVHDSANSKPSKTSNYQRNLQQNDNVTYISCDTMPHKRLRTTPGYATGQRRRTAPMERPPARLNRTDLLMSPLTSMTTGEAMGSPSVPEGGFPYTPTSGYKHYECPTSDVIRANGRYSLLSPDSNEYRTSRSFDQSFDPSYPPHQHAKVPGRNWARSHVGRSDFVEMQPMGRGGDASRRTSPAQVEYPRGAPVTATHLFRCSVCYQSFKTFLHASRHLAVHCGTGQDGHRYQALYPVAFGNCVGADTGKHTMQTFVMEQAGAAHVEILKTLVSLPVRRKFHKEFVVPMKLTPTAVD